MKPKEEQHKEKQKKKGRLFRLLYRFILGILLLLILVLLFIRSPWGQDLIVQRVTGYVSDRTHTVVEIDRLFVSFTGSLVLEGLYLEDLKGDTLIYSQTLEADISLWELIRKRTLRIDELNWNGATARIYRNDTLQGFNYQFLLAALVPPDTTSLKEKPGSGSDFILGDIHLANIRLRYLDKVTGTHTVIDLGELKAEINAFSPDSMHYSLGKVLLEDTRLRHVQGSSLSEDTTQAGPLPKFSVEDLQVNDLTVYYEAIDQIKADLNISAFNLVLPKADLENEELILTRIALHNSRVWVQTSGTGAGKKETGGSSPGTLWPAWQITADEINLVQNHIRFTRAGATRGAGTFNPEWIDLQFLDLRAGEVSVAQGIATADVRKMSFKESTGLHLNNLKFNLAIKEENLRLENLVLDLNASRLRGDFYMKYDSLSSLLNAPNGAGLKVDIPVFTLDLETVFRIQPELKKNAYLDSLSVKKLSGNLSARGTLSDIRIKEMQILWGSHTRAGLKGNIRGLPETGQLEFDLSRFHIRTRERDLHYFVREEDLGVHLPEEILLTGHLKGNPEHLEGKAELQLPTGQIDLKGYFRQHPSLAFDMDITLTDLPAGQYFGIKDFGPVNLSLHASGSGKNISDLDADLDGLASLTYRDYTFSGLRISGSFKEGSGGVDLAFQDRSLDMELESQVELDSVRYRASVLLNLKGADLKELGLSHRDLRTAFDMELLFEGNSKDFDIRGSIQDGVMVKGEKSYLPGDLNLAAHIREDTTSLRIQGRLVNLDLRSNANPEEFLQAITRHYDSYFTGQARVDTLEDPVQLDFFAEIRPEPILNEVLIPDLEEFDTLKLRIDFNEHERDLAAKIQLPYLNYSGSQIDSLVFNLSSGKNGLTFDLGLKKAEAGPLAIPNTHIEGDLGDKELKLVFQSGSGGNQLVNVQTFITKQGKEMGIRIHPDLLLNGSSWTIPAGNRITLTQDKWSFRDFVLRRDNQELRISNDLPGITRDHIGLRFKNFKLAALLSYFNPRKPLASGEMNGKFVIEEPFRNTGLVADLSINDFDVLDVPLGELTLMGTGEGRSRYDLELAIKEGNVDLDLSGSYIAKKPSADIDLQLDLNKVAMRLIQDFFPNLLYTTSGNFSGEVSISGTLAEPVYEGILSFDKAAFTLSDLNAPLLLEEETLHVDNKGLQLNDFEVRDSRGNLLVLDGTIGTTALWNPDFDLYFYAEKFQAFNSTVEDNAHVYGKAVFDAEGTLSGNLDLPVVDVDLEIRKETNMNYVIPKAKLEIEEREGVVVFINKEDPDNILTRREEGANEITPGYANIQVNAYVSLEENATFSVILDSDTGDKIQASGEGDLLFESYPNGRTTLSGRLEINKGFYRMTLYDLVTRQFDIQDGSSITWAGDPLDADLNITAIYRVEASASALMTPQITGADMDVRNRFRQELPFLVYLNIDGEISRPALSFGLDMPEEDQGALGGQVYGRVQQINQQENELNKQVFSLLVLNRFFPGSGSDGTEGGTLSFARDNLNDALSDQLNIFSDRLLGETGIDINFGLDTYTDYQGSSPEERTQLDISAQKALMDDRLVVKVGSEVDLQGSSNPEPSPVIGNLSIEYLLSDRGRFRLKAFRNKSFENVIDGQLIISGLALIFTQEFNKFSELWNQIVSEEKGRKKDKSQKENP